MRSNGTNQLKNILELLEVGFRYDKETDIIYSHKNKPVADKKQVRLTKCKLRPTETFISKSLFKHYCIYGTLDNYDEINRPNYKKPTRTSTNQNKATKTNQNRQKSKKYITDTELLYEIIISKGKGTLTEKAFKMLSKIPIELSRKFTFYREEEKEDAISEAMYRILISWKLYNELKYTSPFTYFTEICKRAIVKSYNQFRGMKNQRSERISTISLSGFKEPF